MDVRKFIEILDADFYSGVPDSALKSICNYLINTYGYDKKKHVIAANEGNAVALAAGYHLATGRTPVVYMQNSGEGNIINPVASLLNDKVYAIPMIFVIGWRGEPGIKDEPQHIYQGEVTVKLLDDMDIASFVIGSDTTLNQLEDKMKEFREMLKTGKDVAFVVRKGALSYDEKVEYKNDYEMTREEIINHITKVTGEDPIISTTGKASRELFEIREANKDIHGRDFLTVGSMGHASMIAMGVAVNKENKKVWCIDGDGAMLMHMGAMGVIGSYAPANLVHIVINNGAHETVGGMSTVASTMDIPTIAKACGYKNAVSVDNFDDLDNELKLAKERNELSLIEIKCSIGARDDLGRPTTTALENKINFMEFIKD